MNALPQPFRSVLQVLAVFSLGILILEGCQERRSRRPEKSGAPSFPQETVADRSPSVTPTQKSDKSLSTPRRRHGNGWASVLAEAAVSEVGVGVEETVEGAEVSGSAGDKEQASVKEAEKEEVGQAAEAIGEPADSDTEKDALDKAEATSQEVSSEEDTEPDTEPGDVVDSEPEADLEESPDEEKAVEKSQVDQEPEKKEELPGEDDTSEDFIEEDEEGNVLERAESKTGDRIAKYSGETSRDDFEQGPLGLLRRTVSLARNGGGIVNAEGDSLRARSARAEEIFQKLRRLDHSNRLAARARLEEARNSLENGYYDMAKDQALKAYELDPSLADEVSELIEEIGFKVGG